MWFTRAVNLAIIFFAVLVILALSVFAMAPHSPAMRTVARPLGAAMLLRGRDKRCSPADVWAVTSGHMLQERERILAENKVIERGGGLQLVATPAGKFWVPAADLLALAGELAEQEQGVHGNEVHPGDIVLDCGANVGVYTRIALNQGARVVVAIDVAPEPLACLRRTFEHEIQEGRVIVYPKGVWDKDATLRLSVSSKLASTDDSVALNRGEQGPEVPLTTIDELTSELRLPRVDFIEMDIEGAESHALQGAAHTIALYKPRLAISMEHKQSDPEEIPALIQRLNSQYQMRYGVCGCTTGRVQPEEIFAW